MENVEFKGCKKGFAGCDGGRMDSGDINLPGATPDKNRGEMKNGETHMYFIEMWILKVVTKVNGFCLTKVKGLHSKLVLGDVDCEKS